MKKVLSTSFELGNAEQKPNLEQVLIEVENWIGNSLKYRKVIEDENEFNFEKIEEKEKQFDSKILISRNNQDDYNQSAGIIYEHNGFGNQIINTEIGISTNENKTEFALTLSQGSKLPGQHRFQLDKPKIINNIITKFEGKDSILPIRVNNPWFLKNIDDTDAISKFILGENNLRKMPVIYLSQFQGQILTDFDYLNKAFAGVAHVLVENNPQISSEIQKNLPDKLRCYDGAIRVYWPNAINCSNEFWKKDEILRIKHAYEQRRSLPLLKILFHYVASGTTTQIHSPELTFDGNRRKEIERRIHQGLDLTEENTILWEETGRLEDRVKDLELQNSTIISELNEYKNQEIGFSKPNVDLRETISEYSSKYSDKILIADKVLNSKEVKDTRLETESFKALEKGLEFLATTYWISRQVEGFGFQKLNEMAKIYGGFEYAPKQNEITANNKKFQSDYWIDHNGTSVLIEEHLKFGTAKDPKKTWRIGFRYLPDEQKILIGYIGNHQQNRKSK